MNMELAIAAGFRGETLTSLSHSKRTHHFLLQVWEALYREIPILLEHLGNVEEYYYYKTDEVLAYVEHLLKELKALTSL